MDDSNCVNSDTQPNKWQDVSIEGLALENLKMEKFAKTHTRRRNKTEIVHSFQLADSPAILSHGPRKVHTDSVLLFRL